MTNLSKILNDFFLVNFKKKQKKIMQQSQKGEKQTRHWNNIPIFTRYEVIGNPTYFFSLEIFQILHLSQKNHYFQTEDKKEHGSLNRTKKKINSVFLYPMSFVLKG